MSPHHFRAHALLALTLSAALSAQVVSPLQFATTEGSSNSSLPWATTQPIRYMQIHSFFATSPLTISRILFRQNATGRNFTGARRIDLQLFLGYSRHYDHMTLNFAGNYLTPPIEFITRKTVNFTQSPSVSTGPNPFSGMQLILDFPATYDPTTIRSLAWEARVYSSTLTSGSWDPADLALGGQGGTGQLTNTGTGCTATGRSNPVALLAEMSSWGTTFTLGLQLQNAAANMPCILAIGGTNPSAQVPGLCSRVLTDLRITLPLGTTSSAGSIPFENPFTFFLENHWSSLSFYLQAHVGDASRPTGLKVANSNGLRVTVPTTSRNFIHVSRLYNTTGTTNAAYANFAATGLAEHGLVTQFR